MNDSTTRCTLYNAHWWVIARTYGYCGDDGAQGFPITVLQIRDCRNNGLTITQWLSPSSVTLKEMFLELDTRIPGETVKHFWCLRVMRTSYSSAGVFSRPHSGGSIDCTSV